MDSLNQTVQTELSVHRRHTSVLDAAPDRLSTATRCIGTLRSGAAADKVRPDARAKRAWLSSSMLPPKQPELPSWIGPAACGEEIGTASCRERVCKDV